MKSNFRHIRLTNGRWIAALLFASVSLLAYAQKESALPITETVDSQLYAVESPTRPSPLHDLEPLFKVEKIAVVLYVPPRQVDKKARKYDIARIGDRGIGKGLNFYSLSQEKEIGRELSQEIEADAKMVTDPLVISYVDHLGQRLISHSDARTVFVIKVLDSDVINALALPGGYFYVTTGLILAADNEAELAAAMAHEIAHVAARHATKNMTKAQIWGLASLALTAVGGPAGIIIHQVADVAVPLSFLKFGRNDEREADLLGLEYQYLAGYDPLAFVNFFERMAAHQKKDGNFVARLWSTHPMTSDRIRRAQTEIETLLPPHDQYVISTNEFDEMKSRVAQLTVGIRSLVNSDSSKPTLRRGRLGQNSIDQPAEEPTLHRK